MAIKINANLSLGSAEFLDARQSVKTLDDLLNINTNIIPNGFQVYVNDLDAYYKYHEDYNEEDTGNWKLYEIPELTILTEEDIFEALGMSEEELEGLSQIIDDEQVSESKAWSSSKIYEELENLKNQGGLGGDAVDIGYENESFPDYTNVGVTLDAILAKIHYVAPKINSFTMTPSTTEYEIGIVVNELAFAWTVNKDIVNQTLTDCTITVDDRTATYSTPISSTKTFSLTIYDEENSVSSSKKISFLYPIYYGCCAEREYNNDFILALSNKKLTSSNKMTYNFNCGDGEYAYFATPEGMKITSAWVNGFQADLEEVATIEHTNASGHTSSYTISRFSNSGLGSFSAEVK